MIQNKLEEKRRRDTIDFHSLGMLLLFFLLFPYTISIIFGSNENKEEKMAKKEGNDASIAHETVAGIEYISLEEYVIGAVAASIDMEYEEEMIKAQAIVIRTICQKALEENTNGENFVAENAIEVGYWSKESMEDAWGNQYEQYYEKIQDAVEETKDMCLVYENALIEAAFFQLSNGSTRDGTAILGENYPYLCAVECEDAVLAADYLQKITWKKSDFVKKLEEITGEEQTGEITIITDAAYYVSEVIVGEKEFSGEYFRKVFGLVSSDFGIQEIDGEIVFTTKGIGHGIGMDQYQGNKMAEDGDDFFSILSYFYQDIEIAKNV